jgi:Mrp family chromosome partitioning ATPase
MRKRRDSSVQQAVVDTALEIRYSAQPGPLFVPGATYSVPAEVVSGMRHMLTRMVTSGQWPRVAALTSALREEGVSYTALALSAVLSQDTNASVCLVDTNWYWPSVPVADSPGLAAVLYGELALDQVLVQVDDSQLMLLPAGHMIQSHRVLAARGPEMKAAMAELRGRFEYVVLDVPAVLATSDAIALAGLADGCCVVVHQGVTPAAIVQEALAALRHLTVTGVIMNNVRVHMPAGLAGSLMAPIADAVG